MPATLLVSSQRPEHHHELNQVPERQRSTSHTPDQRYVAEHALSLSAWHRSGRPVRTVFRHPLDRSEDDDQHEEIK